MDFSEIGIEISEDLAEFLKRFSEDPEIYFTLSTGARRKLENQMDAALSGLNANI